jgi:Holliday junction DNA helicase RuvA
MRSLVEQGKKEGDEVELEIYYHVAERQPRPVLVGFNNEFEQRFFEKLVGVEDIGPSKAAKAFVFSVSTVANAIESNDIDLLEKMPGIGARTAEKLVAALHGKVAEFALLRDEGYTTVPSIKKENIKDEAVKVLSRLGDKKAQAKLKVEEALRRNPEVKDTQELIREVLRGRGT